MYIIEIAFKKEPEEDVWDACRHLLPDLNIIIRRMIRSIIIMKVVLLLIVIQKVSWSPRCGVFPYLETKWPC